MDQGAIARRILRDRHAIPKQLPGSGGQQRREEAQQAGLAAAVAAGQQQCAAGRQTTIEPSKHQPLAAPAGEALANQLGLIR